MVRYLAMRRGTLSLCHVSLSVRSGSIASTNEEDGRLPDGFTHGTTLVAVAGDSSCGVESTMPARQRDWRKSTIDAHGTFDTAATMTG